MTKKDSAFLQRKAEVLQSLGIEATPIKEMTVVDFDYNKNQLKAAAEAKGLTEDEFMKDVDKLAEGEEGATAPGMPSNTKDVIDSQRDPSVQVNKTETKAEKAPVKVTKPKSQAKATPAKKEAEKAPVEPKKEEVKETESDTIKSAE